MFVQINFDLERLCDLLVYIFISLVAVYVLVKPCMARAAGRVALTIAGEVNSQGSANSIPPIFLSSVLVMCFVLLVNAWHFSKGERSHLDLVSESWDHLVYLGIVF